MSRFSGGKDSNTKLSNNFIRDEALADPPPFHPLSSLVPVRKSGSKIVEDDNGLSYTSITDCSRRLNRRR